jgi:hypothetical protein
MKIKLLIALLFVTSCATKIKDFDKYQKQFISKSSYMPSAENLEGKSPKVVVFALEENENEIAKNAKLGNTIANNIENMLTRDRLVELVDRSAATKLEKEIALSEMNKTGSYKGPKVADYAISGAISNADFTSKYTSGSTYVNPKNMQVVTIPPQFNYSSSVSGNIKIYELPSLTVVETVEFAGKKSRSENVRQKGGLSLGALQIGGEQAEGSQRDDGLVRKAGEDGIDDAKVALKNVFAKKGYILEKRTLEDKAIFKITLGSQDGVKQDDEFEVIGQYEVENSITGETEIERRIIGTGKISDQINPKTCWVVLDDKEKVGGIRLGDAVKIKYKRSGFEDFAKAAQGFAQQ